MAKSAGRNSVLRKDGTAIAGARVSGVTMDAAPIDITDNDSNGLTELMSGEVSTRQLAFSVEGVEEDQVLRDIAFDPTANLLLTDITFLFDNGDSLAGSFFMSNYAENNPYEEATTFTAQFSSSGAWTWTPAA